jgi:hypothetical protein
MNHQTSHLFPPLVSKSYGRYMMYGSRITDLIIPPSPLHCSRKMMCVPVTRLLNCSICPLPAGVYGTVEHLECPPGIRNSSLVYSDVVGFEFQKKSQFTISNWFIVAV